MSPYKQVPLYAIAENGRSFHALMTSKYFPGTLQLVSCHICCCHKKSHIPKTPQHICWTDRTVTDQNWTVPDISRFYGSREVFMCVIYICTCRVQKLQIIC